MRDLAARVFYKAHFDIVLRDDSVDLLRDVVIFELSSWLRHKYRSIVKYWNWTQFSEYGDFDTDDRKVIAKSTSFKEDNGSRYWACRIEEFENTSLAEDDESVTAMKRAPRIWTTEVGFEQTSPERATISYVCYYCDKAGFVGILSDVPSRNVPRFIRNLITCDSKPYYAAIGSDELSPEPIQFSSGTGNELANRIKDAQRKAPMILIIPASSEDSQYKHALAQGLATNVMGNALVYEATDSAVSEELTYFLDRSYWCMPGQIRIYWPEGNNVSRRNRYITPGDIDILGNEAIIDIFRRVLATDIRYYESKEMFRMDDCNELYRQSRIQELREKYLAARQSAAAEKALGAQSREEADLANELYNISEQEKEDLKQRIESLETELDEAKSDLWKAESYKKTLMPQQIKARRIEESLNNIRQCSELPGTAEEVARYFKNAFSDAIDFSDRGMRSVSSCTTRPSLLWKCFYAMATNLVQLYRSNTPEIDDAFRNATGWDMARGEGKQTRNDSSLMALRKDQYQGREINIEPHIKKGNHDSSPDSVRVYFCYDKITDRIIIGHVGKHLDNYSTQKI